ncbi:MAG: discoidin domain-containing protein [Mediterranea sp.]|jgi:hypothetical protein|nr:discoidin domain-containing protein [Mediterranea sp.]
MANKKFKPCLPILFLLLSFCFFSCGDDAPAGGEEPEQPVAQLTDVSLSQTLNGQQAHQLATLDEELTLTSTLSFNEKKINWSSPALELTISNLLPIERENIIVTSEGTALTSVEITTENNTLKVALVKTNGSYDYLKAKTIAVTLKAKLKAGITEDELSGLNYSGLTFQSIFYGDAPDKNIKSNATTLVSVVNPDVLYNVKGDPNNSLYPYKLNVVYFVPSDRQPNPGYRKRISTILLKHQLFTCKWMKHWGYEEKSFGLPLDENGMINIVAVNGREPLSAYTYADGAGKMRPEIDSWYTTNNLARHSEHTLVITATPGGSVDVPFFGTGKTCYAYDYPEMAYENMQIDPITGSTIKGGAGITNNSIGGMLHELGHALNQPHVGAGYSQRYDPAFGIALMGSGNQTWGKAPTFFHHASAATLNNCQIASKTEKTFYETISAQLKISSVAIQGNRCTVKGNFTATTDVTDVIVRFYNADEQFLGGGHGYTSIAFVVKPAGNTFELTNAPIEELRVNSYTNYHIGVTILMNNGTAKSASLPYTYSLVNNNGYTLESDDLVNNGDWTVETSHPLPEDAAISNAPGSLVDGDLSTCLSMVKPGKTYGGISVESSANVWAIIDFKAETEFSQIILTNRNFQEYLNAKAVSFYGSNDGKTFTPVKVNVELPDPKENIIVLETKAKCRYLKMTFDRWDDSQGSTMQFAELGLKN